MRKVIANEWMSLDGVVQSAGSDDDTTGGFESGGWHLPYFDDRAREWVADGYARAGGFIFGRRTFELLKGYWPHAPEEEQPVARPLNTLPKYVASTTLAEPLGWQNSTLLEGNVAEAVAELNHVDGNELHLVGSSQLLRTLVEYDLVDGYRLMIDPLILNGGKRIFGEHGTMRKLRLADSEVTTTGAMLATYARADR